MTDVQLASAMNEITDDKLCSQLYPISYGDRRWQSFALSEAVSRGLGDCTPFHRECFNIGFEFNTVEYKNCRLQLAKAKASTPYVYNPIVDPNLGPKLIKLGAPRTLK